MQVYHHFVDSLKPDTEYTFVIEAYHSDPAINRTVVERRFRTSQKCASIQLFHTRSVIFTQSVDCLDQLQPPKDVRILSVTSQSFVVAWGTAPDSEV